jgi:hypothetical protein
MRHRLMLKRVAKTGFEASTVYEARRFASSETRQVACNRRFGIVYQYYVFQSYLTKCQQLLRVIYILQGK